MSCDQETLWPIPWTSPASGFDARRYQTLEVQASGVTGTWQPARSMDADGANYESASAYSNNPSTLGSEVLTITADGFYLFDGGAWLRLSGGSAGTFYVRGLL